MTRIGRYNPEFSEGLGDTTVCHDELDCMLGELVAEQVGDFMHLDEPRERPSTGSQSESGFIPEGAIGKTVGLSYKTEANS
jgi:hypothetical protein